MRQELRTVRAVCPHDCPDTCGIVVQVQDGRAISLKGDPDHPFTRGFLCQKVSHYLDRVYHPQRVLYPMKRVGKKGKGEFTRISWDEAIGTIAGKFKEIAASSLGPQAILPYSYAGTMGKLQGSSLDRRFLSSLGRRRCLTARFCSTAGEVRLQHHLGHAGRHRSRGRDP